MLEFNLTLVIVGITCLISYLAFNDANLKSRLLHVPYLEHKDKEFYRLLTHGFIHADGMHLFINMFVLWMFGGIVERQFMVEFGVMPGRILYLLLYLITIVASSLSTFYKHKDHSYYAALGASGATSGILFAYVLFFPWEKIYPYGIKMLGIPGVIVAILYLVYSSWADKRGRDNIGHDAHFYGAVFGFLFTLALDPSLFLRFVTQLVQNSPYW